MKKFLLLQIKRVLKIFPFVAAVTIALFIGLTLILSGIVKHFANSDENKRFKIALTGDLDNEYIKIGKSVLENLDDTRFAIQFVEMTEEDAAEALNRGEVTSYVCLPEDFIENALHGRNETIHYITSVGGDNIVTMFKNEITNLVTVAVVNSQKGTYGIAEAAEEAGLTEQEVQKVLDELSIEFVDTILGRSDLYTQEELGVSAGLSMAEYLACGVLTLLLMLIGLPYVVVHTKKDHSFSSLCRSRGYSLFKQLLCEYVAHLLAMMMLIFMIVIGLAVPNIFAEILEWKLILQFGATAIPVVIMIAAFNILMFELAENIITGVLLHFFVTLCLCYVSGCMYPIQALPPAVQRISMFLPTGIGRNCLAGVFQGGFATATIVGTILYTGLLFCASYVVRKRKIVNIRG